MKIAKGSGGCWVEVRPLITSELEVANFASILDAFGNFGLPFQFIIKDTVDDCEDECCLVRFFIQFPDLQVQKQLTSIIKALLDVEIIEIIPPENLYQVCLDLELAKNYALPIVNFSEEKPVNLIDRLVAGLAGSDSCVEITVKADPGAAVNIQKFVYEKTTRNPSMGMVVVDQGIDFIGETVGQDQKKPASKTGYNRPVVDPWVKETTKSAQIKLASRLFTCRILIKSNSLQQALAVKNTLPSSNMNRLKIFKQQEEKSKHPKNPTTLKAPSRYLWRNNVFCRLWWTLPLGLVLFAWFIGGVFNPINISLSTLSTNIALLLVVFVLSVGLFIAFRKRQPIVLSTQELAQIVGLPTAVAKLPIALGKAPAVRMQLARNNKTADQENTNPTDTKKEEEKEPNPTQPYSKLPRGQIH